MKISLSWIKRFLPHLAAAPQEIADALSSLGIEVECWASVGLPLDHLQVGRVISFVPHPNGDRLRLCQVDIGDGRSRQIICGAKNFSAEDRVAVALPGCRMPDGLEIREAELRGVRSEGMLCSARELRLSEDHEGILILEKSLPLGIPLAAIFPNADVVFELEITANRGDCMSHLGIARELAAYYRLPLEIPSLTPFPPKMASNSGRLIETLRVESPDCLQFIGWGVRGVSVGPSPEWLRRALENLGLRSINNVVDATNWGMLHFGQPLHAFDAAKIRGGMISVRRAIPGESFLALNHKTYDLNDAVTVIADGERPLVIAGIMGSVDAEVDNGTRNILLEVASFSAPAIQATSRRLGLSTDASQRFSRGVDSVAAWDLAREMVGFIQSVCGGVIDGEPVSFSAVDGEAGSIFLSSDFVCQSVGTPIDSAVVRELLECLYFRCEPSDGGWNVFVPSFRWDDVRRPIDLIEEILRLHGLKNLEAGSLSMQASAREDDRIYRFQKNAAEFLLARGFSECYSYGTRDDDEVRHFSPSGEALLSLLENPLTADQTALRTSLLPGLLAALQHNLNHGNHLASVFEIGRLWRQWNGKLFEVLAVSWTKMIDPARESWRGAESNDFFDHKALGAALVSTIPLHWADSQFSQIEGSTFWQNNYAAEIGKLDPMAYQFQAGLIDLTRTHAMDFAAPIYAGELLLLPSLFQRKLRTHSYGPFSAFPPIRRDFSVLTDEHFPAGKVLENIGKIAGKVSPQVAVLENVMLFDCYRGNGVPAGEKNLTFRVVLRPQIAAIPEGKMDQIFGLIWNEIRKLSFATVRDISPS